MSREFLRLGRAFIYAWAGVRWLIRHERNAQIHLFSAAMAIWLAWRLDLAPVEWGLLILTIGVVFVAEAMNTALEALTDLISPDYHPQAKVVKDVAAGGVLLAAMMAIVMALILFLPKL